MSTVTVTIAPALGLPVPVTPSVETGYSRDGDLNAVFKRVLVLHVRFQAAYSSALSSHVVGDDVKILTHEVAEKLSNLLDMIAVRIWRKAVVPHLSAKDAKKIGRRIYFPVAFSQKQLLGKLKVWGIAQLPKSDRKEVVRLLSPVQPYRTRRHSLGDLKKVANCKHVRLLPQMRAKPKVEFRTHPGCTGMVIQRLRVQARDGPLGKEFRVLVDGMCQPEGTTGHEHPLHPEAVRVMLWDTLQLDTVGTSPDLLLAEAIGDVRSILQAADQWLHPASDASG